MTAQDQWTNKLSGYIDDELSPHERAGLDAHLASCAACTAALDELREVVVRAGSLMPRPPSADLWPGIAPRLEESATVTPFQPRTAGRRFSFTMPQLVAAGLALMVMSGGGVWVLQHGGRATDTPAGSRRRRETTLGQSRPTIADCHLVATVPDPRCVRLFLWGEPADGWTLHRTDAADLRAGRTGHDART